MCPKIKKPSQYFLSIRNRSLASCTVAKGSPLPSLTRKEELDDTKFLKDSKRRFPWNLEDPEVEYAYLHSSRMTVNLADVSVFQLLVEISTKLVQLQAFEDLAK